MKKDTQTVSFSHHYRPQLRPDRISNPLRPDQHKRDKAGAYMYIQQCRVQLLARRHCCQPPISQPNTHTAEAGWLGATNETAMIIIIIKSSSSFSSWPSKRPCQPQRQINSNHHHHRPCRGCRRRSSTAAAAAPPPQQHRSRKQLQQH